MKKLVLAILFASCLSGCASAPEDISANYTPPAFYSSYDCDQIKAELIHVSSDVERVTGQQRKKANNDKLAMGVGLVVFWPALFFLATGDKKEELANLKGQYDALVLAANGKKCSYAAELKPRSN